MPDFNLEDEAVDVLGFRSKSRFSQIFTNEASLFFLRQQSADALTISSAGEDTHTSSKSITCGLDSVWMMLAKV